MNAGLIYMDLQDAFPLCSSSASVPWRMHLVFGFYVGVGMVVQLYSLGALAVMATMMSFLGFFLAGVVLLGVVVCTCGLLLVRLVLGGSSSSRSSSWPPCSS